MKNVGGSQFAWDFSLIFSENIRVIFMMNFQSFFLKSCDFQCYFSEILSMKNVGGSQFAWDFSLIFSENIRVIFMMNFQSFFLKSCDFQCYFSENI